MTQWEYSDIPQWVYTDGVQWGISEDHRIYVDGMEGYLSYEDGFNSIAGNTDTIYLATNNEGILYVNKSDLSTGSAKYPTIVTGTVLKYFAYYPEITAFKVNYVHCNDNFISAVTDRGLDIIQFGPQGIKSQKVYSVGEYGYKCFVTNDGHLYYTLSGTDGWHIDVVDHRHDWSDPDVSYITGSGILAAGLKLNDIFVTEGTSTDGTSNTIFCATTSGAYVIDEGTLDYYVALGENYNSIWTDSYASINEGKMYIATNNSLGVFNLTTKRQIDYYSTTIPGSTEQTIKSDDMVDINHISGV